MPNKNTATKYEEMCNMYGYMRNKQPSYIYTALKARDLGDGSIRNILCAFKWKYEVGIYDNIIKELNKKIMEEKKENTNRFAKIKWEELDEPRGTEVEDVIKGLYMMFPPRRIEDYAYMLYIDRFDEIGEYNYYVRETSEFVFKRYKTYNRYGVQKFKVPNRLKNLIEKYVNENEISSGDNLLQYNGKSGKFSERTLRNKLHKIFGVSADGIRHAYITNLYKNPANLYKIKEVSEKMAHSVGIHMTYLDKDNK